MNVKISYKLMNFPNDFRQICDQETAGWPRNWFENFGSNAFFHVVGLREYIDELYGPISPEKVAEKLTQHEADISSHFSPEWLAKIFETDIQDIDIKECMTSNNFTSFTRTNIRNAFSGTPLIFTAALPTFLAASLYANGQQENERNAHDKFEIRFAGYYIMGFGDIFPRLSTAQKARLAEYTQQTVTSDYECFYHMAEGRPVTKPLADRIAAFLEGEKDFSGNSIPKLQVKSYKLRTDVGKVKSPAKSERTYLRFRVVG